MANQNFLLAQIGNPNTNQAQAPAGNTTKQSTTAATAKNGAENAAKEQSSGPGWQLAFPIILVAVFYFLLIRPQQKKEKKRRAMLKELKKGDKVLTRGGILGVIVGMKEEAGIAQVKIGADIKVDVAVNAIEIANPSAQETQKG